MRHYSENHFVPLLVHVNWEAGSHPSPNVTRKHERAIWLVDRMKQVRYLFIFFNGNEPVTISRETSEAELLQRRCWRKWTSVIIVNIPQMKLGHERKCPSAFIHSPAIANKSE